MRHETRFVAVLALVLATSALTACCEDGGCIKDPPCRPCENPCGLSPIQEQALAGGTHALGALPVVYTYEEKTYFLFTEAGLAAFDKDPTSFDEKGALRLIRRGTTRRADLNPGEDFDWEAAQARARPFTPPPKK